MIVTTTDGKRSEVYLPVNSSVASLQEGWRSVGVPLQAISGFDRTNKVLQSVAFSGDVTGTFYIGAIGIINDPTPIKGDVNVHDVNLALGDEYQFTGRGDAGSTPLKYSWDFGGNPEILVDAEGQTVYRKFRKAGDYTITLTISDLYGLKKPYSTKIHVHVNP